MKSNWEIEEKDFIEKSGKVVHTFNLSAWAEEASGLWGV